MSPEEVADLVRRARERGEAIAEEQRQHQKLIAAQRNAQPQGSLTAHMLDDATIRRLAATTADSAVRKGTPPDAWADRNDSQREVDMSAYLILIGAADLVGRSPWPLVEAFRNFGFKPTAFTHARNARDEVMPDAAELTAAACINDRAGRRARAKLRESLLEAAARLNDRSRCR